MKEIKEFDVICNVPQWAVCGLVNDDWSGIDDDTDIEDAKAWLDSLLKQGWTLLDPVEGSENDFCAVPAFGLACDTVDFNIVRIKIIDD